MAKSRKVIITCAVTGSIHTPSMSPHLPITAQEIADAAIGAAEAGAAIVHLHARNPQDGRPDQTPEAFAPFLKVIKQRSNVVVNITTGGAPTMTAEERVKPAATFKPEVASLNMGTMNFGLYPMIPRYKGKFKHDWEEPYLEGSRKGMFKNTFADIEYILTTCAENGTRFEVECYDIGHLYTLKHFLDRGVIKAGMHADVTIFDEAAVCDRATFENPVQTSAGIRHVLVNGVPVVRNGAVTGARPGRGLKRSGATR